MKKNYCNLAIKKYNRSLLTVVCHLYFNYEPRAITAPLSHAVRQMKKWCIMVKEIPLTRGQVAIVDDDWYEMLSMVKWQCRANGYVQCGGFGANMMHRVVADAPIGIQVDHINGDTLDNRAINLRFCNNAQNQYNRAKHIAKSSMFKGVFWCNTRQKWYVKARINGKQIYIGTFSNEAEGAMAYQDFARKHHGEFNVMRRFK